MNHLCQEQTLAIRPATAADARAIAGISDELRAHVGDPTGHFTAEVIVRDGFGAKPEFELLVAERDGRVVGYALFQEAYEPTYAAKGLYLADLAVTATARRTGVGRALVEHVSEITLARGRRYVWWHANPKNESALVFYRRIGVDLTAFAVSHVKLVAAP
jgi:ribosomal protein S18 acetylase RimI-like enzyme